MGKKSFISTYKMHSVFFRSLTLVAGCSFVLTALFYIFITRVMEENYRQGMETASRNALDQIVATMDFTRDYAQSTMYQLITNRDIVRFIIIPDMRDTMRNFQAANILGSIVSKNDLFKRLYLYNRGNDSVLSSDSRRAYRSEFWEPVIINDYLDGKLRGYEIGEAASLITVGSRIFFVVDFFFSVPNHNGVLFAELDPKVLLKSIYQNPMAQTNPVYIYDCEGRPLFPLDMEYPKEGLAGFREARTGRGALQGGADEYVEKTGGSALFYRFSEKTGWHYVYQVDERRFEAPRFQFLFGVLPIILFILCVSFLLSLYVARGMYTPIQRLLHLITSDADYPLVQKSGAVKNEYDFLTFAFQEASQFRGQLSGLIDRVRPAVMEKILAGLLCQREESLDDVCATLRSIQSPFLSDDVYGVLVFGLPAQTGDGVNLERDIVFLTVRRQFEALAAKTSDYAFVQPEGAALAVVLHYAKTTPVAAAREKTLALVNALTHDARSFAPSLLAGGGKSYAGLMDIGRLYREAQEDIRYQSYFGASLDGASEKEKESAHFQFYLSGRLGQVSSAAAQNKSEEAQKILLAILDEIESAQAEVKEARHEQFLTALTAMMLSFGVPVKEAQEMKSLKGPEVHEGQGGETYRGKLTEVCRRSIALLADYQKRYQHRHIVRAKEYIAEHYSDSAMGLERVADFAGIKASYLSTLFNEKVGEHFVDYLNTYRIEKAKDLLGMTQTSIKEIGHIVGFNSDHTFIRVFKKYESRTPGQYRDSVQHDRQEKSLG
jgi:AraC-like DNA-binding protein